ncbi:MAG: DUF177 domain-containing protein [Clostridia bacterium]|nr:DUF177 domain-containing protein [Clostridia bacterium]
MIFELEPIFNTVGASLPVDYEMDFSDVELSGVRPFREPVRIRGEIRNRAGIVSVAVHAHFALDLFCDRCAGAMRQEFDLPVEHVLVRELQDESNDELICLDSPHFDLDALVSEDVFLSLPTKFLCSADCKGICPTCGQNLNDGPCSCKKSVDPRLEGLLQLLDNS